MKLQEDQLKKIALFIEKEIGIIYTETNYFQLEHRLEDALRILKLDQMQDLWKLFENGLNYEAKKLLLDLATNNETSFFRDQNIFNSLSEYMIPKLLEKNPDLKNIRIWSAAGSTGQEAYSLAIILDQMSMKSSCFPHYEIFVTDLSERALNKAREGLYSSLEIQRGISSDLLQTYFDQEQNFYRVKNRLKEKLSFKQINLLDFYVGGLEEFHIIFCRNVLIYQSVENKISVVKKLLSVLKPHGFFVLGSAESMMGISDEVTQVQYQQTVFYQKK
jgi:chemotaxis protein methyltransferase CheR